MRKIAGARSAVDDAAARGAARTRGRRTAAGTSVGRVLQLQADAGNRATGLLLTGRAPAHPMALGVPVVQRADGDEDDSKLDKLIDVLDSSSFFQRKPDEGEIQTAVDLWLSGRAGNVHDVDVAKEGTQLAGEVSGGVGGAAYGRAAGSATSTDFPFGLTLHQFKALVELGAYVGAEGKASGQIHRKLGPGYAKAMGSVKAFAGALARARASGQLTFVNGIPFPVGLAAAGSANAFAGAKGSAEGEVTLSFSPHTLAGLGASVEAGASGMAGAEAKAEGKLELDVLRARVTASGAASAFAGASVDGSVGGSAKLYGRKLLTLRAKGSASAGAGGKVEGGFSLSGGKLTIKVSGMGALGVGLGAGSDFESDFKPLAVFIWRQAAKAQWKVAAKRSSGSVRAKVTNYQQALDADVKPKLEQYRDLKLEQLRMNEAVNYVKIEKVQAILDWNWPRAVARDYADRSQMATIDAAIEGMIRSVFQAVPGLTVAIDVKVSKGRIQRLQTTPRELAVLLGGGIEGRHAHGTNDQTTTFAAKNNLVSDVGK